MMHNCKKAFIKMFVFAFFLVVFTDKWIYIQKGSTKEVSTEAFHTKERLSFNGKYTLVSSLINRACVHMFFLMCTYSDMDTAHSAKLSTG